MYTRFNTYQIIYLYYHIISYIFIQILLILNNYLYLYINILYIKLFY